jgi:hypothetical protein
MLSDQDSPFCTITYWLLVLFYLTGRYVTYLAKAVLIGLRISNELVNKRYSPCDILTKLCNVGDGTVIATESLIFSKASSFAMADNFHLATGRFYHGGGTE